MGKETTKASLSYNHIVEASWRTKRNKGYVKIDLLLNDGVSDDEKTDASISYDLLVDVVVTDEEITNPSYATINL